MNILLITTEFGEDGGGLALACQKFSDLLTDSGHQVLVVDSSAITNSVADGGYRKDLPVQIANEYRLKHHIEEYRGRDVGLTIAFGGGFNGFYASLLSKGIGSRFILMLRGSDVNLAKWDCQNWPLTEHSAREAEWIVCLSHEMERNLLSLVPDALSRVRIIPNVIDAPSNVFRFKKKYSEIVLGTAATHINEKKGISNLLDFLRAFKTQADTPIRLDIVGQIDKDLEDNYKMQAEASGLSENVRFCGRKSREEFHKISGGWDFYVQGSVCEGFGNSVAEMMQGGKGVIISPTGFIAEALKEGFTDLIFPDWTPSRMAETLQRLISHRNLAKLYKGAYSKLCELAGKEAVMAQWNEILGAPPARANNRAAHGLIALALHDVGGEEHDHITTPTRVFEKFVSDINDAGYTLCSMRDYLALGKEAKEHSIVCTFDDGYSSLLYVVAPILKKFHFTATAFINTRLMGESNDWNCKDSKRRNHLSGPEIQRLHSLGWEIGSHGDTHRNLLRLTENEMKFEFKGSKIVLEYLVGDVSAFAYPYGESTAYIRKVCGRFFKYAFSLSSGGTELAVDNMQIRRYSIDEIYSILGL